MGNKGHKAPTKRLLTKRAKKLGAKWNEANYKRGWYQVGRHLEKAKQKSK